MSNFRRLRLVAPSSSCEGFSPLAARAAHPRMRALPSTTANPKEGGRATSDLPDLVRKLVAAVAAHDTDAFLALFVRNGMVDDWGRRFVGHDAIRRWSDQVFIGAKGVMTPREVIISGDSLTVDVEWQSHLYGGDSRFVFVLEGDAIRKMYIVERRGRGCILD